MNIDTIKFAFSQRHTLFGMLGAKGFLNWMPDKMYLKILFRLRYGRPLNLDEPKTFNEKLQWLKLYNRNPLYTKLVDKYEVRQYISEKLGEEYLFPLVGGPWDSAEDIDFDALPERFVLKPTHDSGSYIICTDKSKLDIAAAKAKLAKSLQRNYYWSGREWPYKNVKPRIIAEQYMEDGSGELRDYKIYCSNGSPKFLLIVTDRQHKDEPTKFTFFDPDFNKLPFEQSGPNDHRDIPKPANFDQMLRIAALLSENMPHVRVDLYDVHGKIYFGELTFFDSSGMDPFDPPQWDEILGSWIELPEKKTV